MGKMEKGPAGQRYGGRKSVVGTNNHENQRISKVPPPQCHLCQEIRPYQGMIDFFISCLFIPEKRPALFPSI